MDLNRTPTLKQLRYFAALAELGHYRKAAERVGISQPSLSLQIDNLETALGVKLVERGRAGAVLTPAGREVLARSHSVLDSVASLMAASEQLSGGLGGTYRLGASATLGPYLLPSVVRALHSQFPSLRLIIRDGAPQDLLQDLLSGHHDLILTQLPIQSTDVRVARLFREPLKLVAARGHPLAELSRISDTDLAGETILVLSSRFTLHGQITDLVRDVGGNLRQDYEGTSLDAIRQMIAMNMGISFLPALYVASEISNPEADVAVLPYRRGRFFRSIGLVWRKSAGASARFDEIAETIREVARTKFSDLVQLEK